MSATSEHYMKQAEQAERDAAEAQLDNVRERALRSAQAWRSMAERLERAETMRIAREADKAASPPDIDGFPAISESANQSDSKSL